MFTTVLAIYGVLQGSQRQPIERLAPILDRIAEPIDTPVSGSKSVGSGERCWLRVYGTWVGCTCVDIKVKRICQICKCTA